MGILCFPSLSRQAYSDGVKEEECGIHGDTLFSPAFPASWDGFKDEKCGILGYTLVFLCFSSQLGRVQGRGVRYPWLHVVSGHNGVRDGRGQLR